jgi:hypothetical protein
VIHVFQGVEVAETDLLLDPEVEVLFSDLKIVFHGSAVESVGFGCIFALMHGVRALPSS